MLLNENGKLTFGKVATKYDLYRPGYPNNLIRALAGKIDLQSDSTVLESGCGTGQFTKELAKYNPSIHAIDISSDMIAIARDHFKDNSKISFSCTGFEDYPSTPEYYDAIVAATSFHWLDKNIRLVKSHEILKKNGSLVLIQNIGNDKENILSHELAKIYDALIPSDLKKDGKDALQTAHELIQEISQSDLFNDPEVLEFEYIHSLNANHYIELLDTSSFENNLPAELKLELFSQIHDLVQRNGNRINLKYQPKLILAQKR